MTNDPRTRLIAGLRDMADFLDTNPDIPTPPSGVDLHYFPGGQTDQDQRDHIDQIATYLGSAINLEYLAHGHYQTEIGFGPVTYRFVAIAADVRARHRALNSYHDCVTPESSTTDTGSSHDA